MNETLKNSIRIILVTLAAILISIAAVLIIAQTERAEAAYAETETASQVARGTAYIKSQEAAPVAPIEEAISAEEQEVLKAEERAEFFSSPDRIFEALVSSNTVLVGESRTAGFSAYGFLDDNHVLGGIGWSIQEIPALYEQIAFLAPSNIVFSFGINELGRYPDTPVYYYSPELFTQDLDNFITTIRGMVPGAKIYVNCIVPCTDAVYEEYPGYGAIPEWNEHLKAYCEEKGYGFIDISDLCAEHVDMYIEDGTHLVSDFYPYWGARILEAILDHE